MAILGLFLVFNLIIYAQEKQDSIKVKTNPIVFGEINIGYSNGYIKGLTTGLSLNYQTKRNLVTFRSLQRYKIEKIEFFIIFPITVETSIFTENSLLYGKRYIKDDFSYHFSGGISYNDFRRKNKDNVVIDQHNFIGFPLEIGYRWFKPKKERFRVLYGLIPIGKPTSFGGSVGLKLYGNIAKNSYVGLSLSIGLGWHKKY